MLPNVTQGLQVKSLVKRTWLVMSEAALWDLVERLKRPVPLRKFEPEQVRIYAFLSLLVDLN